MSNQIKRFRILTWVEMTKLLISIVFCSDQILYHAFIVRCIHSNKTNKHSVQSDYCRIYTFYVKQYHKMLSTLNQGQTSVYTQV